jgi:uncharacterized membrane protein YccC
MATERSAGPRWPAGVRAAASTAIPVVIGLAAGDLGAGLIATIGAFTSGFGSGRPYFNRGVALAVIAVTLALAVTLGAAAAPIGWLGVLTVTAVGVTAVWLCNALAVGPPGAYIFVVACAAGIGVSAAHLSPWRIGLLVLGGGAIAWMVHMAAMVTGFRRPERAAVAAAGEAVATYIEAAGTDQEGAARHRAAAALQQSWNVLISYQPMAPPSASVVHRLRAANHALHVLFATAMSGAAHHGALPRAGDARELAGLRMSPNALAARDVTLMPLGRPGPATLLRQAVVPGALTRHVMVRVAVAAPIAGAIASTLGFARAYWAIAAAVLVLHQGADWLRTLRRGIERLLGTWVGLGLAALILLVHPQGLWLAAVLAVLSFTIAILVVRTYALAAVFITATALTIASGAHRVDVGGLLIDRGVDTLIGCAVGLAVYLALTRRQEATRLTDAIADTLDAAAVTATNLGRQDATTLLARAARRDLQVATMGMLDAYDAAVGGSAPRRKSAERHLPTVVAAEQLAYRTLAACWAMQQGTVATLPEIHPERYPAMLRELAAAVRTGAPPPPLDDPPVFARTEVSAVRESLRPPD